MKFLSFLLFQKMYVMIREKELFMKTLTQNTYFSIFLALIQERIGISVTFAFGGLELAAFKLDVSCWSLIIEDRCVAMLSSCMNEYCIPIMAKM